MAKGNVLCRCLNEPDFGSGSIRISALTLSPFRPLSPAASMLMQVTLKAVPVLLLITTNYDFERPRYADNVLYRPKPPGTTKFLHKGI